MTQIPVQDLMNRQIPTVLENASLDDAAIALLEHDSGEVYVVSHCGTLRGVVPEYEILKARLCGMSRAEPVTPLITRTLRTVGPQTAVASVASLFREGYRSSIAVVDDKGRLLGQLKRKELIWLLTTLNRLEHPDSETAAYAPDGASAPVDQSAAHAESSVPRPKFLRDKSRKPGNMAERQFLQSENDR